MAGFTVRGVFDGAVYDVEVTGDADSPIVGNGRVAALVASWVGRNVQVTAQGPVYTVSPGDTRSILAVLSSQTAIKDVGAGAPQLLPPPRRPAVD